MGVANGGMDTGKASGICSSTCRLMRGGNMAKWHGGRRAHGAKRAHGARRTNGAKGGKMAMALRQEDTLRSKG